MSQNLPDAVPVAVLQPRPRFSWLWLLPLLAAGVSIWLLLSAYQARGLPVVIEFAHSHGLKPGDALRLRGAVVGTVDTVRLLDDLSGVQVRVRLHAEAAALARAGSRFWIVRPQLGLSGISGLETVIGANYLHVLPGDGPAQTHFTGLDEPPPPAVLEPGGLNIVLTTPGQGDLRAGAPVSYRQVTIGAIVRVDLATDASAVEAEVYIRPAYTALIRAQTRFWKAGGARLSAGLTGLAVDVDSVQGLLLGGVNIALPPDAGGPVAAGHTFPLYEKPDSDWLDWLPALALDGDNPARQFPPTLSARLVWQYKNLLYLTQTGERSGWVLPVTEGVLGPADLLTLPDDALPGSVQLVIDGIPAAPALAESLGNGLARLLFVHTLTPWPDSRRRRPAAPEDTLLKAAGDGPVRRVDARHYRVESNGWQLDPALFTPAWHGATVLAASDGALLGLLLLTPATARVALFAETGTIAPLNSQ